MDAILEDYKSLAGGITYSPPKIPLASTLLGAIIDQPGVVDQYYLAQQTRQAVNFAGAVNKVKSKLNDPIWLEIGPAPVCSQFIRAAQPHTPTKTMHTIEPKFSNWASISKSLSVSYTHGLNIDWLSLHKPYERDLHLQILPAYAWDMKDYWVTFSEANMESGPKAIQVPEPEPYIATCAQYLVEKRSTPTIEVTLRARISDPSFLGLIDGHRMQQVGLASGSVFCDAALTTSMYALDYIGRKNVTARSLALHDPELLAPLTRDLVGVNGELHTTAVMDSPSGDTIKVSFKATSDSASHNLGSITVKIGSPEKLQADWDRVSYFIKAKMEQRIGQAKNGLGHRLHPDVLYALFAQSVEFDSSFKGIREGYIAEDFEEAAALVTLKDDPVGSQFTFSPYWSEALAHLAGFMVNGNPNLSPDKTFIVMGFEKVEHTVDFVPGKQYMTYTRISRWEKDTAFCDAFIFDAESSKLIMQCTGLRYQQLPRATWRHILGGKHSAPSPSRQVVSKEMRKYAAEKENDQRQGISSTSAVKDHSQEVPSSEDAPSSGEFEAILNCICKATGTDFSEFGDETALADLGIDSIMAIEVVSAVNIEVGIELPASFILDYPTIGDLRREFGAEPDSTADQQNFESSSHKSSEGEIVEAFETQSKPDSISSTNSDLVNIATPSEDDTQQLEVQAIDDSVPQPDVRITLLQGRPRPGKTPLYMMADGTGSIATYIHLPSFKSKISVYGVDSPFLRCPSRLTPDIGIEGVAKLIVDALVKARPTGPFYIGGFSAGSTIAYEVARQLPLVGRKVDGLFVIDLCCPRPATKVLLDDAEINRETDIGITIFGAAAATDGLWTSNGVTGEHLRVYLKAMRQYHPPPMTVEGRPTRAAVIWAEKGMVNRVRDDPKSMKLLVDSGIPIKPYAGFMEDPKLGPFACFIPDKTEADLGPNGWDKFMGDMLTLSMDADHLDMPMPGHVHLLHEQLEKVLEYFSSAY